MARVPSLILTPSAGPIEIALLDLAEARPQGPRDPVESSHDRSRPDRREESDRRASNSRLEKSCSSSGVRGLISSSVYPSRLLFGKRLSDTRRETRVRGERGSGRYVFTRIRCVAGSWGATASKIRLLLFTVPRSRTPFACEQTRSTRWTHRGWIE